MIEYRIFEFVTQMELPVKSDAKARPFLRWAGGKHWLTKHVSDFLPPTGFKNYHEPFLGGAALFFHLNPKGTSFLSDINEELIDTYLEIKKNVEGVIAHLARFKNTRKCYYETRSSEFRNPARRAARFIFLNQTSFNGIYRVNLRGEYNVPYGFRTKDFFEPYNLRTASTVLRRAKIFAVSFDETIGNVSKGDLVFLDPPYTVTHYENGFIKYNQKLFALEDQHKLSNYIDTIRNRNAYYILTNANHSQIVEIFDKKDRVRELKRASLIGGSGAKRGRYSELVFTNSF